ncbi:MAG: hypothetical protein ACJ8LG_00355 [Massilia sp.]
MHIRPDLQSVQSLLSRLLEYAKAFTGFKQDLSHLKHNEDFRNVYELPLGQRQPLEEIYADGGNLAGFMKDRLVQFNDASLYPTLKSYVDSFEGTWIHQTDMLARRSMQAKTIASQLPHQIWAINQMIGVFDKQIQLLLSVKQTVVALKASDTYQWESGTQRNTIHTNSYARILESIHSVGKMFERLPATYADKDEEQLRDHILVTLSANPHLAPSGETFNKRGKTDIFVRQGNSTEFIGECKFWRGEKVYVDTISQLLSYLSWRDNQAAVILFVPNAGFSAVLQKISEYTATHPNFVRHVSTTQESWQNYEFKLNGDEQRVVSVAILAFHMP